VLAEATDFSKDHPDIVARLSKLAIEWKATLPIAPNPECLSKQITGEKPKGLKPKVNGSNVWPEVRAKAFERWDANNDDIMTLDEYQAGLNGQDNLETRFKNFDKNSDGKRTRDEFVGSSTK